MYRLTSWIVLGLLILGAHAAGAVPEGRPLLQATVSVGNEFVQADAGGRGQFTIGTRGGDPGTAEDDGRRLMYGFGDQRYTSLTSVRLIEGGQTTDVPLTRPADRPAQTTSGAVTTRWEISGVIVTQTLEPAANPYTGRPDTIKIATQVANRSGAALQAGARVMIDTMIGGNDDAPFFVPGTGNTAEEQEYLAERVPPYWKAFEAVDFSPTSLKGQGILTGFDATPPDRFILARWPEIIDTDWDYQVSPGTPLGDSAVALYWMPEAIAPGASATWVTYYGLAGAGGGNAWIDAPVSVTSLSPAFQATLWVSNRSDGDFTGGQARLALPAGLRLADGESETKPMPPVPAGGGAQSVTWRLTAGGGVDADFPYSGTVAFQTGSDPLSASSSVRYQFVALTATPTAQPTPTATPTPPPTSTPVAIVPIAVPPPSGGLPWWPWLLLVPLAGVPLLWLLLRRSRPARPVAAPPAHPRPAPPIAPDRPTRPPPPSGADVTHGRGKSGRPKAG